MTNAKHTPGPWKACKAFVARAEQLNGTDTGPLTQARAAIAKATGAA